MNFRKRKRREWILAHMLEAFDSCQDLDLQRQVRADPNVPIRRLTDSILFISSI